MLHVRHHFNQETLADGIAVTRQGGARDPPVVMKKINHWIEDSLTMNKSELVEAVSKGAKLTKADAGRALDATIDSITRALKKGDDVSLVGFGTFTVRKRAARVGRNPQTGEAIKIKASKNVAFKSGKGLKDAVN